MLGMAIGSAVLAIGTQAVQAGVVLTNQYINVQWSTVSNFASGVTNVTTPDVPVTGPINVTIPVGAFIRFGTVETLGTTNPDGASGQAWDNATSNRLPANLGMAALSMSVGSTNLSGSLLAPLSVSTPRSNNSSTAVFNQNFNNGSFASSDPGDTGANGGQNPGVVGGQFNITEGNIASAVATLGGTGGTAKAGREDLAMFGGSSASLGSPDGQLNGNTSVNDNGFAAGSPQEFFQDLAYKGNAAGSVSLTPVVAGGAGGSLYWTWTNASSASNSAIQPTFGTQTFTQAGDSVGTFAPINVTIGAPVPEPTTLGLMGIASLGLLARIRARKERKA